MKILVINCGSSSIKYRLFDMRDESELARGLIDRIGEPTASIHHVSGEMEVKVTEPIADYEAGVRCLLRLLQAGEHPPLADISEIDGVGHRVVHGGEQFYDSVIIDRQAIKAINSYSELAPLHNPANLAGIEAAMHNITDRSHVAVFDTAFFQTMPQHAYIYALPYEWYTEKRIRRYGFHGTSHRYVSLIAAELMGNPEPNLVTMHLGNGCSTTCIRKGKAIDQSMGLTPLEGLVMGTRCGDVDPAIVFHLTRLGMELDEIHEAMENRGGLLGISGISRDIRDVYQAAQKGNQRAELALEVFAYRAKKYLGAFIAQLGQCHAIVFTGGIGEKASFMRAKIINGLEPMGIELDPVRNDQQVTGPFRISTDTSKTEVWVIPTNEELMIARDTWRLIRGNIS
ncbi:MAG: acetate kinase [Planctomycetota bacterium]|nr:MAG: acetate kinase [Planctomycetota bacterium]